MQRLPCAKGDSNGQKVEWLEAEISYRILYPARMRWLDPELSQKDGGCINEGTSEARAANWALKPLAAGTFAVARRVPSSVPR
jgi:hypothetical protein